MENKFLKFEHKNKIWDWELKFTELQYVAKNFLNRLGHTCDDFNNPIIFTL